MEVHLIAAANVVVRGPLGPKDRIMALPLIWIVDINYLNISELARGSGPRPSENNQLGSFPQTKAVVDRDISCRCHCNWDWLERAPGNDLNKWMSKLLGSVGS